MPLASVHINETPIPFLNMEDATLPRQSVSHPLRARSSTGSQLDHNKKSLFNQKKAVSLDRIPNVMEKDEAFGSVAAPASALGHARRTSKGHSVNASRHRRMNSGDNTTLQSSTLSRSTGQKSGLALSLNGLPDFSYSGSSLSSLATSNMTPPASAFSPAEPPIFEDVKPLQEAFEQPHTALRKFKPRDSGVAMGDEEEELEHKGAAAINRAKIPPPSVWRPSVRANGLGPKRPPMLKRTSSMGNERDASWLSGKDRPLETPIEPSATSGWPGRSTNAFSFLGEEAKAMMRKPSDDELSIPSTPVKRNHFAGGVGPTRRIGHSSSQPSLASACIGEGDEILRDVTALNRGRPSLDGSMYPSMIKVGWDRKGKLPSSADCKNEEASVPRVMLSGTGSSPGMDFEMEGEESSPSVRVQMRGSLGNHGSHYTNEWAGASMTRPHGPEASPSRFGVGGIGSSPLAQAGIGRGNDGSGSEGEGTPTRHGAERGVLPVHKRSDTTSSPLKDKTVQSSAYNGLTPETCLPMPRADFLGSSVDLTLTPSKCSANPPTPLRAPSFKPLLATSRPQPTSMKPLQTLSKHPSASSSTSIYPRLSLPAFTKPQHHHHRTLHHRQSHPATQLQNQHEEDVFESRFITLETLGKGAFSVVVKVQDRRGDGLWAVKKARGVFDGVRDRRLRHLEEVDILRHLSSPANPHVIRFESAWEQNRQLFIQTELCLGNLAFFLEEYGRVVERLDEGRVWKIVRELADGIHHIHSNGVIHFDLKPANIFISDIGTLKIGDFGMASRYPRISPADILQGSGLGNGTMQSYLQTSGWEKLEREGDRVYMPPEMLRGIFGMPADIFSFGLVVLEVSTNICVPDGGPAWHSLRIDDFTVVDLSPLSPALADLITTCMASEPGMRPTSEHLCNHPVIVRSRTGGAALAPESKEWLAGVLGGYGFAEGYGDSTMTLRAHGGLEQTDGDIEMMGA